jgi:hypothetical protein
MNLMSLRILHNAAIVDSLTFIGLCPQYDTTASFLLEVIHFSYREITANISINEKESGWTSTEYLISEMIQTTPCPQCTVLLQISIKLYTETAKQPIPKILTLSITHVDIK